MEFPLFLFSFVALTLSLLLLLSLFSPSPSSVVAMKLAPRPPRSLPRPPPFVKKPSFSLPSPAVLHSLFLSLFLLYSLLHFPLLLAFLRSTLSDSSAVWATLPFAKLSLSVRRVSWAKAIWGRRTSEGLERAVYDGLVWTAMVLWVRSGWGAHRESFSLAFLLRRISSTELT